MLLLFLLFRESSGWNTLFNIPAYVIGHRGDAFYMPEHSYGSYTLGMQEGADYVEADLVMSFDGVPVCSHNAFMSTTTNVASMPEFESRQRVQSIDGGSPRLDWWYEDFTLSELKTLRLKQAVANISLRNNAFDLLFEVLTFEEHLQIVQNSSLATGKEFHIIPEIKHSTHYAELNVARGRNYTFFEDTVIALLHAYDYLCDAQYDMSTGSLFIQSFEVENLQYLNKVCSYPLLQLMNESSEQVTPAGLEEIATYAQAVGLSKDYVKDHPDFVSEAHKAGLFVSIYTIRNAKEDPSVNSDFGGDIQAEYIYFYKAGVDAVFSEKVDEAMAARRRFQDQQIETASSNEIEIWQIATASLAVPLALFLGHCLFRLMKPYKHKRRESFLNRHRNSKAERSSSFDNFK